jgi:hypothetical protein
MFQTQNHSKSTPQFAGPGTVGGPSGGRIQRITFCATGQARMRTIVARSRMRPTWKYPSIKNVVINNHGESPNELIAFCFLDFDWKVLAYREQPCEIVYLDDDGVECRHFPDLEVLALVGPQLWEVKPERFANTGAIRRRTEILSEALPLWGFVYMVVTAEELNLQPRKDNTLRVLDFARRPVTSSERAMIAHELEKSGQILWRDALVGRYGGYGREILCRLVIEGHLQTDMQQAFSDKTKFVHGPVRR